MRITSVDVVADDPKRVSPPFRWRDGLPGSDPVNVGGYLVVGTDEGIVGIAPVIRSVIADDVVLRRLRPELIGADPLRREYLWHRVWELDRIEDMPNNLVGIANVALWDIGAQAAGLPLHRLLGSYRDAQPAYASTVTFESVEQYLSVADQCLALGYPAIKLHAWGDPRRDAELIGRLREHVGDGVPLMYDGSGGFDLRDAQYVGHALDEAGYEWYEEPMREASVTAYRWLGERVTTPLLVGETSAGAHLNTADFVASGCATMVRTGWTYRGGVTGAMRIAHLADAFQLRAEVHGQGPVNVHLNLAIPNSSYYESLIYTDPVSREPAVGADGLVRAPQAAGNGYSDEELAVCGLAPRQPTPERSLVGAPRT